MSTSIGLEPWAMSATCRTLAEYIDALVQRLAQGDPEADSRLRAVVGALRARITLDGETAECWFEGPRFVVLPGPTSQPADGEGSTDRATTLELLGGYLEVSDAILDGRLRATGEVDSLARIFQAIEILLDASTRVPALPRLALDYGDDPCRPSPASHSLGPRSRAVVLDPGRPREDERDILRRLDLLP
ncbi:MAG: hypothetical protein M3373_05165 [Gemmatimonadota bacterium]|nr:hypothetical protein [Gemmatimonadota bacterium]